MKTERLSLQPVVGKHRIQQAHGLLQLGDIKSGLDLPSDLSLPDFRKKLLDNEPLALYLLEETTSGNLVGLVGAWAVAPHHGWSQILYAIHPGYRGNGYAREGSQALVRLLFKVRSIRGVGAMVIGSNAESRAILRKVGMDLLRTLDDRQFFGLSREQFEKRERAPVQVPSKESGGTPDSKIERVLGSTLDLLWTRIESGDPHSAVVKFLKRVVSVVQDLLKGPGIASSRPVKMP
jgi:hypothetical protein